MSEGSMEERVAVLVMLEARPGKELEVEAFLTSALELVQAERGTLSWYAMQLDGSTFCIFDTFADAEGRDAHLAGDVARALAARADELFESPPHLGQPRMLAAKKAGVANSRR